jgi:hypothetical protein
MNCKIVAPREVTAALPFASNLSVLDVSPTLSCSTTQQPAEPRTRTKHTNRVLESEGANASTEVENEKSQEKRETRERCVGLAAEGNQGRGDREEMGGNGANSNIGTYL